MLAKVLGMLGSAHDGEVINAARNTCRLVQERGATWPEVLGLDDMEQPASEPYHLTLCGP